MFTIDSLSKWLIVAKQILTKVQKDQRQKKHHTPNFQYSTIGRRILATDNITLILNIHNIKKYIVRRDTKEETKIYKDILCST